MQLQQAAGQLLRRQGPLAAAVEEIQPAQRPQLLQHRGAVAVVELAHQVAEGSGPGVHIQQAAQAMVPVHHPEAASGAACQRHRLLPQVAAPLLVGFASEISPPVQHLGQADAHLRGLQLRYRHFEQRLGLGRGRQGLKGGQMQDHHTLGAED